MARAMWSMLLALVATAAIGCDQSEPPVVTSGYFPLRDGATYSYLHSKGGWTEELAIKGMGQGVFMQTQTGDPKGESSSSELHVASGDVLRVAEDQLLDDELVFSTVYDPGFLRFSSAWEHAEVGDSAVQQYERTETKAGQDAKDPETRAHRFTVESVSETVTVPAGTFRNCLRIKRERALDASDAGSAGGGNDAGASDAQDEQEKLYWFADGVGKVREENVMTGSSEVLLTYEVPEE